MKKLLIQMLLLLFLSSLNAQENIEKEYQIIRKFIIFQVVDKRVRIREIVYIDAKRWDLPLEFKYTENIPDNADILQFPDSAELQLSGNTVTGLIQAEAEEVTEFTYTYFINEIKGNIRFGSNYFIKNLDIYIPVQIGIELKDSILSFEGTYNLEENSFLHYKARNIEENSIFEPDIVKAKPEIISQSSKILDESPSFHSAGHIRLWYQTPFKKMNPHIFTLIITGLFIIAVYMVIRKNFMQTDVIQQITAKSDLLFETLYSEKKKTLNDILSLDTLKNENQITMDSYKSDMERLKTKLININRKLKLLVNRNPDEINDSI